jgi:hypothetical protein
MKKETLYLDTSFVPSAYYDDRVKERQEGPSNFGGTL